MGARERVRGCAIDEGALGRGWLECWWVVGFLGLGLVLVLEDGEGGEGGIDLDGQLVDLVGP